jgi:phosphoribosylamine--glycine ligase
VRVLLVGHGGREHVLAVSLAASPEVTELFVAPGNPGTGTVAKNVAVPDLEPATIVELAEQLRADLVVVGPEEPLVGGVIDRLSARGLRGFGPTGACARLEGSKTFANDLMGRYGVPTARSWSFRDVDGAIDRMRTLKGPWVVKADGLTGGKGVTVTERKTEAETAIRSAMEGGRFGAAGRVVVLEEYLEGPELSLLVLTDGREHVPLRPAQDHKRVDDGNEGPNTGGMGAYTPVPIAPPELVDEVMDGIVEPVLHGLKKETDEPYRGVLYVGLCLTEEGPKVVEFNCRFGDPEAQVVVPLMLTDFADTFAACADGGLAQRPITWLDRACVTVVLASPGYPESPRSGQVIKGVDNAAERTGVMIFHAATRFDEEQLELVTAGGRVLDVTALGATVAEARQRAYAAVEEIDFEGMHYRTDIAQVAER